MSQLYKLRIQGFRSFSPREDEGQVMDFVSTEEDGRDGVRERKVWPLTLILGQNGCGKTTVIECLRYVTTGDHPPGSNSGRSFVHDPKMAAEHTVKACVKLMFRGRDGRAYTVSRLMEAQQKPRNITIRTLDGQFVRNDRDGIKSLSTKCADINALVLEYMGVEKPILNYVIFCHQEDSNWPLEEGSKVKAKFDEIFASDKYQACLKNLKEVRTVHLNKDKALRKDLEYLASDKKMAADKRRELQQKKTQINALEDKIKDAETELEPIKKSLVEINEVEMNYNGIIKKKVEAEAVLKQKKLHAAEMRDGMQFEMDDLDEQELEQMRRGMQKEEQTSKRKLDGIRDEIDALKSKLADDHKAVNVSMARIAEYKSRRDMHRAKREELDRKAAEVGRNLGWAEDDEDDVAEVSQDEDAMEAVLDRVRASVAEADKNVKKIEQEMDAKIDGKTAELSELEAKSAVNREKKEKNQKALIEAKKEIAIIIKKLKEAHGSVDRLRELQEQQSAKEGDLERVRGSVDLDKIRRELQDRKRRLRELEQKEKSLREEKSLLDGRQKELTELRLMEDDKASKDAQLDRLRNKCFGGLEVVFGSAAAVPKPAALKDAFTVSKEDVAQQKEAAKEDISKLWREAAAKKEKRRQLKQSADEKEAKVRDFNEKLRDADVDFGDDGDGTSALESALEEVKADLERANEDLARKEANKFTYNEFINKIESMLSSSPDPSKTACPTCNRAFHERREAEELRDELRLKVDRIPGKVRSMREKVDGYVARQGVLQTLSGAGHDVRRAAQEAQDVRNTITKLDRELRDNERNVSTKENSLSDLETKWSACEEVHGDVMNMCRLDAEARDLADRVREARDKVEGDAGTSRSLEEFKREEEATVSELDSTRRWIEERQQKELQTEKEVNRLERELNQVREERLDIERRQQESSTLEEKKAERQKSAEAMAVEQEALKAELEALAERESDKRRERNRLAGEKKRRAEEAGRAYGAARDAETALSALVGDVRAYNDGANESKMRDETARLAEVNQRKAKREGDIERLEVDRSNQERRINEHAARARDVETSLKLKRLAKEVAEKEEEVRRQADQLRLLDHDAVEKKKRTLQLKYQEVEDRKNASRGRLGEMRATARDLERELATEKFGQAERKFSEAFVERRMEEHVCQDLERYFKALNHAITKFHKERMAVINRLIRDLWRQTYKGNDIDYIEIQTDEPAAQADVSVDRRRNVNYRVVMVKAGAPLEMRGRCSAGQKVLASLVIRLALAETFSSNCGIIALDEPTTNLDRDNIESLAEALSRLVEARSESGNFQLIVITHDEDLISMLGRQVPDQRYYYKISRNEKSYSNITRRNFDGIL